MALIKCPECGQTISDTAAKCIHCGYDLRTASANMVTQTVSTDIPTTNTEELYNEWLNEPTTHRVFANKNWGWLFKGLFVLSIVISLIMLFTNPYKTPLAKKLLLIGCAVRGFGKLFSAGQRIYVRTSLNKWMYRTTQERALHLQSITFNFYKRTKESDVGIALCMREGTKQQYVSLEVICSVLSAVVGILSIPFFYWGYDIVSVSLIGYDTFFHLEAMQATVRYSLLIWLVVWSVFDIAHSILNKKLRNVFSEKSLP